MSPELSDLVERLVAEIHRPISEYDWTAYRNRFDKLMALSRQAWLDDVALGRVV